MLRINIFAVFIAMTHAMPAPYYSLVESPTSRVEQHFFTSSHQQPVVKVELQQQILPMSAKQEFPNQHIAYFYPEMQIHGLNHHRDSWQQPQHQFIGQKVHKQEQSDEDKSEEKLESSSEILNTSAPENIEIGLENASTLKPTQSSSKKEEQIGKLQEIKLNIADVLPKQDETTPKIDVESIEIRADSNIQNQISLQQEKLIQNPQQNFPQNYQENFPQSYQENFPQNYQENLSHNSQENLLQNPQQNFPQNSQNFPQNPQEIFNHPQLSQPLLHRIYTINNQFYMASAPEFYGFFHPVHNPAAPIFSLQELQPIVRNDPNIEAKTAKINSIAALPMSSSVSRTNQDSKENREGEADLRSQLPSSALRINVVDEDETEEIKSSEATEIKARSKLPSRNQSSGESEKEVEASREEDKSEQSVEGDALPFMIIFNQFS